MRRLVVLFALFTPGLARTQLTDAERAGIRDALYVGNLKESDLLFSRRPFNDPQRLGIVDRAIDDPLRATDEIMSLHQASAGRTASGLLAAMIEGVFEQPVGAIQHDPPLSGLDDLPADLRGPILGLANWINSANNTIRRATDALTAEERRALIESLPVIAVEEPSVTFSFVRGEPLGRSEAFALLAKVDLAAIRSAGQRLAEAAERAIEQLKSATGDLTGTVKARVGGMPVVIAGRGNDSHTETDALLTIDLGGDDTYTGRHGAGVGYASVLIDLGGDDTYDVGDLSVGAAILGVGLAYDEGGSDRFFGKSITFGSGLAGVGSMSKRGGNDAYRSETLTQGFAMFGIGVLIDSGGKDTYDLLLFGQGASRTQGVGWLVDASGSDTYRAGGLVLNSPLFATAHYSFAQGFSQGFREDTGGVSGGVGLITDHGGDDVYVGETYQQAASYWFSLGTLFDASGNDTYSGYHYCQASAMHATAAFLFDLSGDDGYIVKVGAAHAIGHDYGVALLLDRKGDDTYASRDSTPGIGNANGLGVFVEGDGIDRYFGPPGKGNPARGTGSLGVFVDLNGSDDYRYGLSDGRSVASETWGVAIDRPTRTTDPNGEQQRPPVTPGTEQRPSDEEMAQVYARAAQWDVGTAQGSVADNLDRLVRIGSPALEWMLNNRLATADRLQIRAFVHVVQALGQEGSRLVGVKAFGATDEEMLPLIRIASDANVTDFGAVIPGLIKNPALRAAAVAAAGVLKAKVAVNDLMALCRDSDKLLARAAMVSLLQIADPASIGTAQAMMFAEDLMTRRAAIKLLAKFPEQAASTAEGHMGASDEYRARVGIELMSEVGTPSALEKIGGMLLDPRPGVRIECLLRLNGRCPAKFRADYLSLRSDPVAAVKSVAAACDPGDVQ
jgi:hypothetical protein